MGYQFTAGDVAFLRGESGAEALGGADRLPLTDASLLADLTTLRRLDTSYAAAIAETVRLRRRAASRWASAGIDWTAWLFTDQALQQASPPPVAAHRARRLVKSAVDAGFSAVHDLTCSIGADLAALAGVALAGPAPAGPAIAADAVAAPAAWHREAPVVVGSDIDPVRLAMARHNIRASALRPQLLLADARTVTTRGALRYADPARRDSAGRRITSADTIPSVAELDAADPANPPVLRLPPGIDYETLARSGEIEIVSWNGIVREAVSWPAPLATARRRATVLGDEGPREQLTDGDPAEDRVTPIGRYLADPDPAVVRAHLVQHYAARHGLTRLDPHLAYLTGDTPPRALRAFEVLDAAPYSEKIVRGWVRRDAVGTLEIKQRGTPVIPDELRKRVKPSGDTRIGRTLVVARIGRSMRAFWCRAIE